MSDKVLKNEDSKLSSPFLRAMRESSLKAEEKAVRRSLPPYKPLPDSLKGTMDDNDMWIAYVNKAGDTTFKVRVSDFPSDPRQMMDLDLDYSVKLALVSMQCMLRVPCTATRFSEDGNVQSISVSLAAPYPTYERFVLGNIRTLVFDERYKNDTTSAIYPDVVTNPLSWSSYGSWDVHSFSSTLVHEAGHNYCTARNMCGKTTQSDERIAVSFELAFSDASIFALGERINSSTLEKWKSINEWSVGYSLSYASSSEIAKNFLPYPKEEMAALNSLKHMSSTISLMALLGQMGLFLAFIMRSFFIKEEEQKGGGKGGNVYGADYKKV